MANSKAISIRIPDQLLGKIDKLAEEKYKSHKGTANRSLVILDIIADYFDTVSDTNNIDKAEECQTLPDTVSIVEFNGLRDIVDALSITVRQLEGQIINFSGSGEKPSQVEQSLIVSDSEEPNEPSIAATDNEPSEVEPEKPGTASYLSWVRFHKFIGEAAPTVKNKVNGENAVSLAIEKGLGEWKFNSDKNRFTRIG
jgi:hypothetical protein